MSKKLPNQEEPEVKLFIIGTKTCGPCKELQNAVKTDEIRKALKEKFGTDEVAVLYGDEDSEDGNKARNFCYSIDHFGSPMLVAEKKIKDKTSVCLINENLEEEKCGVFRELPM
jgi:hypothetical protein